jgi:hypothetical protein
VLSQVLRPDESFHRLAVLKYDVIDHASGGIYQAEPDGRPLQMAQGQRDLK